MSGAALDHRLARGYLGELDAAVRGLPAAAARELKEQITAHLEDALGPDAGDQEVAAARTPDRVSTPQALWHRQRHRAYPDVLSMTTAPSNLQPGVPESIRPHPAGRRLMPHPLETVGAEWSVKVVPALWPCWAPVGLTAQR
jgi:hypothetical protein